MTPATAAPAIQDAAQLRTAYPDFVNQIVEEAIKAERDRLKDIDSIANGIPNDVLMKAKYEEPLSAADLALAPVTCKQPGRTENIKQPYRRSGKLRRWKRWNRSECWK